jgi:predicted CoA-binding protein
MMDETFSDTLLRRVLRDTKTVACVGVSLNETRPSYFVARYLALKGFKVMGVNPGYAGQQGFGGKIVDSLEALTAPADMVDIFRRSDQAGAVVDEALALPSPPKVIWMQIGVINEAAAERARAAGVTVIMNRCPKIEYQRLFGELRMGGFNTGIISSKLN